MNKGDVVMGRRLVPLDDELCYTNRCSSCPKYHVSECNDTRMSLGDTALVVKTDTKFDQHSFLLLFNGQLHTYYRGCYDPDSFEVVT
jgi:hypothetical protein